VVERYRYTSFGQLSVLAPDFSLLASPPKVPFTYTSREWEPEVEMYFYRARFMDPRLGRFRSQDPLGFAGGDLNIMAYCGNNPVNALDPLGLVQWKEVGTGVLTTIGGVGSMVGGAILTDTGVGAPLGVPAMLGGAVSTGLGITTIAHGFEDNGPASTPTGSIPQGPVELAGAMTGNANIQTAGGMGDSVVNVLLPPNWSPIVVIPNILINPPVFDPNAWPFAPKPQDNSKK